MTLAKLVSGGQTGADRGALDAALALGIPCGGWVPRGRRAEDGEIPDRYLGLVETATRNYEERTRLNVRDSDATLIVSFGPPTGGTRLTVDFAVGLERPHLVLDLEAEPFEVACRTLEAWLEEISPGVLNVAGPRASKEPRIAAVTETLLEKVLRRAVETEECA